MPSLHIRNFSCLKDVTFEVKPIVAIIGPQGSGKSLIAKLNYFFSDIEQAHFQAAEHGDTLETFKKDLAEKFKVWFPVSAWGPDRFNIHFENSLFTVRAIRRTSSGKPSGEISFSFSKEFEEIYEASRKAFKTLRSRVYSESNGGFEEDDIFQEINTHWKIRSGIISRIRRSLGPSFINNQIFVPAGRAFYTSIGKMVAGFDNSSLLDPLNIKFAKLFSSIRESNSHSFRANIRTTHSKSSKNPDILVEETLLGGRIIFERSTEYLSTDDGRKVPIGSLSSGQQELYPVWSIINQISRYNFTQGSGNHPRSKTILYIEEPEAHLFPSAQSLLLSYMIEKITQKNKNTDLIITTHSPYIMGRLNVLLKAGSLSRRKKKNTQINEIIPRDIWITPASFSAYAVKDGKLIDIVDENGLIDSEYLDSISNEILSDFDKLLEIEMEMQ